MSWSAIGTLLRSVKYHLGNNNRSGPSRFRRARYAALWKETHSSTRRVPDLLEEFVPAIGPLRDHVQDLRILHDPSQERFALWAILRKEPSAEELGGRNLLELLGAGHRVLARGLPYTDLEVHYVCQDDFATPEEWEQIIPESAQSITPEELTA